MEIIEKLLTALFIVFIVALLSWWVSFWFFSDYPYWVVMTMVAGVPVAILSFFLS